MPRMKNNEFEALNFELIYYINPKDPLQKKKKYKAHCNVCNKDLTNTAADRLRSHSVVTSVSVITNRGNETKTFLTNLIENPELKTNSVGSPGNLLSPDKYEFYTFDEAGDLVKRLMTWNEIQGLIAGNDADEILADSPVSIYRNENIQLVTPEAIRLSDKDFSTSDIQNIHKVVESVQNVLKNELAVSQSKILPIDKVTSFSSEPSNWSLYLPTLWENINGDVIEELHHLSNGFASSTIGVHDRSSLTNSSFSSIPQSTLNLHNHKNSSIILLNKDDNEKSSGYKINNRTYPTLNSNKYSPMNMLVKVGDMKWPSSLSESVSTSNMFPTSTYQVPNTFIKANNTSNEDFNISQFGVSLINQTSFTTYSTQSSLSLFISKTYNYTSPQSLTTFQSNLNDFTESTMLLNKTVYKFPSYYSNRNHTTNLTTLFEITTPSFFNKQHFSIDKTTLKSNDMHSIGFSSMRTTPTIPSSILPTLPNFISDSIFKTPNITTVLPSIQHKTHLAMQEEWTTTRPEPLVTWISTYPLDQNENKSNNNISDFEKLVTEQYVSGMRTTQQFNEKNDINFSLLSSNMKIIPEASTTIEIKGSSQNMHQNIVDTPVNTMAKIPTISTSPTIMNTKITVQTSDCTSTEDMNSYKTPSLTTTATPVQFTNLNNYSFISNRFQSNTATITKSTTVSSYIKNDEVFHNATTSSEQTMQRVPTIDPPNKVGILNKEVLFYNHSFIENNNNNNNNILIMNSSSHYHTSTEILKNLTQIAIMVNRLNNTNKLSNKNYEMKQNLFNLEPYSNMITSNHTSKISDKDDGQILKSFNATKFSNNCTSSSRNNSNNINNNNNNHTSVNNDIITSNDAYIDISLYSYNKHPIENENISSQKWTLPDKQKENSHIYYYKLPPISPQLFNQYSNVGVKNVSLSAILLQDKNQNTTSDVKNSSISTTIQQNDHYNYESSTSNRLDYNIEESSSSITSSLFFNRYNNKVNGTAFNSNYMKPPMSKPINKMEYHKVTTIEHPQKGSASTVTAANNLINNTTKVHSTLFHQIEAIQNDISAITNYLLPEQGHLSGIKIAQNLESPEKFIGNTLQNREAMTEGISTNTMSYSSVGDRYHINGDRFTITTRTSQPTNNNEKFETYYPPIFNNIESVSIPYGVRTTITELPTKILGMNDQDNYSSPLITIFSTTANTHTVIKPNTTTTLGEYILHTKHTPIVTTKWSTNPENITAPFSSINEISTSSTTKLENKNKFITSPNKILQNNEQLNMAIQETQETQIHMTDFYGSTSAKAVTTIKPLINFGNESFHSKHSDAITSYHKPIINKNASNINDDRNIYSEATTSTNMTTIGPSNNKPISNNSSVNLRNNIPYMEVKLENKTQNVSNNVTKQNDKLKIGLIKSQKPVYSNINTTINSHTSSIYKRPINSSTRSPTSAPNLAIELHPAPHENMGLEASTTYLGDDVRTFIDLCNEFSFKLWITQTGKSLAASRSIVSSPFATLSTLAMIFLGARGSTSGLMNDFLRLDDMVTFNPHQVLHNITESVLNLKNNGIANVAFVREIFSDKAKGNVLEFYRERLLQYYDSRIEEINFDIVGDLLRRKTNLLVKKQTQGRIQDFLKGSTLTMRPPLAVFTANIFQTDCSSASTEGRDGEMYFVVRPSSRQRRLIPIPAVVYRVGFLAGYEPGLDATAVTLNPDSVLSTILVLPGQQGQVAPGDGLARLEQRLLESSYRRGAWSRLLRSLLFRHGLEIQVPRFSHKSILNSTLGLQKMGMNEIFSSNKADLSGINGLLNELHLSDMIQVNMFSLCGENTIDARHYMEIFPSSPQRIGRTPNNQYFHSTNSEPNDMYSTSFNRHRLKHAKISENPRLRFDRPFLYVVRHNPTGMILYIGRFNPRLLP